MFVNEMFLKIVLAFEVEEFEFPNTRLKTSLLVEVYLSFENFEFLKTCKTGQTLVFGSSNNKVSLSFLKTLVWQAAGSHICPLLFDHYSKRNFVCLFFRFQYIFNTF